MSQTAASFVHTGPWINWSHGLVLGSTITLNQQDGALLTAFLGIFVTTAGAACWKIMSFALHQHRSLRISQDGIHHQQQAILRNTGSPSKASLELAHLAWSWRVRVNASSFEQVSTRETYLGSLHSLDIFRGPLLSLLMSIADLVITMQKHALRPLIRTLPLIALAFVNFALFGTYINERACLI